MLQVRSMKDNVGEKAQATPSTAVQMSGLNAVPIAGDDFSVAASLDEVTFCLPCTVLINALYSISCSAVTHCSLIG